MSKVIYKYSLYATLVGGSDGSKLKLPDGAEFLCVQVQYGEPAAWFSVDPKAEEVVQRFQVARTGEAVPHGKYLGTFQLMEGQFVGHLYETTE